MDESGSIPLQAFTPHFIGILVCFLLVFLFSGLEAGLLSLNRIWLNEKISEGNRRAKLLHEILRLPSRLIAVMLTMETTCSVVLAVLWTIVGDHAIKAYGLPSWSLVIWEAVLILLLVMFCEIVPKALFASNAEHYTMALAPTAYVLIKIVHPFAVVMEWTSHLLIRSWTGKWIQQKTSTVTEQELMTMVSVGEDEGVIEEQEMEMIHSIFEFGDLVAREIMVPRVDMVTLDINDSVSQAIGMIVKYGHSRIPVYTENQDHIKGILYAKDLLKHLENRDLDSQNLAGLIRTDVLFVPATKDLTSLLEEMRARKAHMAVVMDEYGGTAGLVTIEDILEEIVGDIQDEYDKPLERLITDLGNGTYIVDAILGLHDFEDEIGVKLPEEEGVETLGGLLYQILGRLPKIGDEIPVVPIHTEDHEYQNGMKDVDLVRFKILEVDETRIGRVNVRLEKTKVSSRADDRSNEESDEPHGGLE